MNVHISVSEILKIKNIKLIDNGKKQKSFPFYIILQNPNSEILYVNYVMVVRQPNDFSTYKARASSRLKLFSEQYHTFGFFPFAKIKEIETFTVIGVYLRFYRNKKIVHPGNIDIQLMSKKTDKQIKKLDSITTNENDIPLTEPDIDNDSYDRTENSNSSFSEDLTENNSDYTVYSKYKYIGSKPEEISVNKGVKLAVTDWNAKEGWVKVYQVGNKNNKGLYPINYIINSIKC
ncbi:hypothetical protein BCR32DRAFT_270001 [Anaeromyces robustus]|uniref:SH3 domain-containing protein n=1 Tax=Anaeromyces robustus TaxID=1754192 RepID=A0A1Y1WYF5_9FUNG|nr:hypothetical protein BCR32DRAFT_270001 [Anaeromyces robustus]|eukprot:ORX78581.1 hypothetical protein BCR32DRAFT_270001 [Anaeromyces robustus]